MKSIVKTCRAIVLLVILFLVCGSFSVQDYKECTIEAFYKKIKLDYGTLDESGSPIDFIFVKTSLDVGKYEVKITDGPGDLYEIKDTDIFIKFNSYYGYAGYGNAGILVVNSGYNYSKFYKEE